MTATESASEPDARQASDTASNPRPVRLGPAAAGRCRRRVHLDHAPGAPRADRSGKDDGVKMRLNDMALHTEEVLARFSDAVTGWSPHSTDRPALIRTPTLRTVSRIGTPELLIADGHGYVPVLIRGHRTLDPVAHGETTPEPTAAAGRLQISTLDDPFTVVIDATRKRRRHSMDLLQLAHHHTMLAELGLAPQAPRGGVIGRGSAASGVGDSEVIVWHDLTDVLAEYAELFADRQAVAQAAATGGELARPSRISECRRCSWWPVCSAELQAAHDVSLLTAGSDVEVLRAAGLHTLDDVVRAPESDFAELALTAMPAHEARVRAKAFLDDIPMVRRTESVSARRADVEMDIDMESYLDDGAYLWGTLLSGADVGFAHGYRPFVTFEPLPGVAEGEMFVEFWAYLSAVRAACAERDLTFAAYCWSRTAEERWLFGTPRRYPRVYQMPTEQDVAEFCRSDQWIDLYAEVKQKFLVPGSLRLKAIAPVAGFSWRDAEPGGENSMAWYRAAIGSLPTSDGADPDPPDLLMRQRILDYNEDDVRATAAIREWMSDGAQRLPTTAHLIEQMNVRP